MATIMRSFVALAAAAFAALAVATPAQAGLLVKSAKNCDDPASAQVFQPWLDPMNYVPAPGAHAESAAGWTLKGGARVVAGNEPWKVGGRVTPRRSLIPSGRARRPARCASASGTRRCGSSRSRTAACSSTLLVEVVFEGLGGALKSLPIGVVVGGTQWQPTLPYPVLASLLPLLPGQMTPVQFRFTPLLGGSWQIDDVYVDPWRAR